MLQIRLIQRSDWQGLCDLINSMDRALVGIQCKTKELINDWINTLDEGIWEVYIAILPKEELIIEKSSWIRKIFPWKQSQPNPIGCVGVVTLDGDWQDDENIQQGEFDIGISVDKKYHRKGIGIKLLEFILERGKQLDYEKATLWTRKDNLPMINLAEKLGFQKGRNQFKYGYVWIQFSKEIKEK